MQYVLQHYPFLISCFDNVYSKYCKEMALTVWLWHDWLQWAVCLASQAAAASDVASRRSLDANSEPPVHDPAAQIICQRYLSALTLLDGRQEGHLACKKLEWWGTGMVIWLEWDADLHMSQLMPLPLTVSCFSKIQIGFTFLVLAHRVVPEKGPLNGCVCDIFTSHNFMFQYFHKYWYMFSMAKSNSSAVNHAVLLPRIFLKSIHAPAKWLAQCIFYANM